ncbi:MAG: prolyl oligopeptidase family serine peptidase [Fuerstiella sp.]|nr:prolyl oligopeptidase family serine peptidase [Fuerstiella sp.]
MFSRVLLLLTILLCGSGLQAADQLPRRLPPAGIEIPLKVSRELSAELAEVNTALQRWKETAPDLKSLEPDVAVYLKAVRRALANGEFWNSQETEWAGNLLATARRRLQALQNSQSPFTTADGMIYRGFRSALDDSVQPYGLQIPEGLDHSRPAPLYVFLHGRNEKMVELQFLEQFRNLGRVEAPGTFVLHVFGRYCNGYKAAGEVDVREAVAHVCKNYKVDRDRIAITGFSMGGAGVWHLAAHYPDLWMAASPGAGFAETAQYNKLKPAEYPPWYEQSLWGLYDVPGYVRNLFNMEVIAYSGELDPQMQASSVMASAYRKHGRTLNHIIGPNTGHKYHSESRLEILRQLAATAERGLNRNPESVTFQTRTLRYDRCRWVRIVQLQKHWTDSHVDARQKEGSIQIATHNVAALEIQVRDGLRLGGAQVRIDGTGIRLNDNTPTTVTLFRNNGTWSLKGPEGPQHLQKTHGLQGPIDDAFLEPFLVVTPGATAAHPRINEWVHFELNHFIDRWRRLFRGDVRMKADVDVTAEDMKRYNLILWGDPTSNKVLAAVLPNLPLCWTTDSVTVGPSNFSAAHHVPVLIYPNPAAPDRYVVINSGITFREAHDRTNSLQNPKLPDWAILNLDISPNTETAGRVVAADFFDERWQVKPVSTNK